MSPTGAQGQAWGRWGGKGFRVAPRPLAPGMLRLGRTDTVGVTLDHTEPVLLNEGRSKNYQQLFK